MVTVKKPRCIGLHEENEILQTVSSLFGSGIKPIKVSYTCAIFILEIKRKIFYSEKPGANT